MNGKGDKNRTKNYKKYWENFNNIDSNKSESKATKKKLKGGVVRYTYK